MTKRFFSLLMTLALLFETWGVIPAYAIAESQTQTAQALLQFTSGGHALGFTKDGMYAATGSHALHVDFVNANRVQPQAPNAAASTDDNIAPLSSVTYTNLWPGISLDYTATGGVYTTTYRLAPGADANNIQLGYNAPLSLNEDGTLNIAFETGSLNESAPIAWQEMNGQRVNIDVAFFLSRGEKGENEIGFTLGKYDPRYPLTIEPHLQWHTFLGGSDADTSNSIAVDNSGNIYVSGTSISAWGSPLRAYTADFDAFVAKLDSSGALQWNTFLGGDGMDFGGSVAVDGGGNIYFSGSSDLPWGSPLRAHTGGSDAFAAKLDSSGVLQWHTFLGGSGWDEGFSIVMDDSGNAYISGISSASWGSPLQSFSGSYDAFAAKLGQTGSLQWHTFLGGSELDSGSSITVDDSGNLYISGESKASWGSPLRAYTGNSDAFAAKLDSSGSLRWNTFLGGSEGDYGQSIAVDNSGNVYLGGSSFASWGSPLRAYTGDSDIFAAKLDLSGNLQWHTFLGSSGSDYDGSIALDNGGTIYVSGSSNASWGSPLRAYAGVTDAFAATLDSSGTLVWNTFLGGSGDDYGTSIAVNGGGNVYVGGNSNAIWDNPLRTFAGGYDTFVARIDDAIFSDVSDTYWAASWIERLYIAGITGGCGSHPLIYCPENTVTRAEMAVFLLRGMHGSSYIPPAASGNIFGDVPATHWAANWIEQLYVEGITGGCETGSYCPQQSVTRAEMAVFLLRAKHGASYLPPAVGISTGFGDVPTDYWAAAWIKQLAAEGITSGWDNGNYGPEEPVTRAQMAIFLVRVFELP